ncbi:MAG: Zn-dependent exopeptidase M28 [Chloroflexi bacterium]|nr:Zn-dependent exopeptidase M28 [Chloroflexota bacterium]
MTTDARWRWGLLCALWLGLWTGVAAPAAEAGPHQPAAALAPPPWVAVEDALTPDPRIQEMMAQVRTDLLLDHLLALSGERPALIGGQLYTVTTRYADGVPGGTEGLQKAAQYLLERYAEWGIPAEAQRFSTYRWQNVVATLPGAVHPERVHLFTAHYDSVSEQPLLRAPGADDNGSGAVAVLLAASILRDYQFADTIRFIHFSAEERGLRGAWAYAQAAAWRGEEIVDVVNLDMIAWDGWGGPDMDLHASDAASQAVADDFAAVIEAYGLNLIPQKVYGAAAATASDHSPFWSYGIPAILAIEDYHSSGMDFCPYYHRTTDLAANLQTPTCANCLGYFTEFSRAALGAVAHRAGLLPAGFPTPTATPTATATAVPTCGSILVDGGFEAGPTGGAWTTKPPNQPIITGNGARSGAWGAQLGSTVNSADRLFQPVALPPDAHDATLAYWWQMESNEWQWGATLTRRPRDRLWVQLLTQEGHLLQTLEVLTEEPPQGQWAFSSWDVGAYAGQTVQLRFAADTDGSDVTRFLVDDVTLRTCAVAAPTPTATATATAPATSTATPPAVQQQRLPLILRAHP